MDGSLPTDVPQSLKETPEKGACYVKQVEKVSWVSSVLRRSLTDCDMTYR